MMAGDGWIASLAAHAMSDWGWGFEQTQDSPLAAMIMTNRHERRLQSKKGFGWSQLDGLEAMKRNG